MKEELKAWLSHYVMDAILSPAGAKVVGLISAVGNLAYWVQDNINFIAAVSGIAVTWLVYLGSEKKRKLEMQLIQKQLDEQDGDK
jgi:hypothetical protein